MALTSYPRENFVNDVPETFERGPLPQYGLDSTVAMHWDGTYRDRVRLHKGQFWTEEDYNSGDHPWPASNIAKHLAPETFNSDNAESVAGWII